jgi:antirestriction protein ArdC
MAAKKEKTQLTRQQTGCGVYKKVTETLIGLIEDGHLPWRTSWSSVRARRQRTRSPLLVPDRRLLLPISLSSGKPYQGIYVLILWAAALRQRYASQYWGTFKVWNQLDCQVKTGEKATGIIRWIEKKEVDPKTGQEEDKSFPVGHPVFNVAQVQGPEETMAKYGGNELPLVMAPANQPQVEAVVEPERWEPAENLVTVLDPKLRWGGDSASYSLHYDQSRMPKRERFDTQAGLYSVLMHEVAHWTGHPKRLARDLSSGPKTPEYWFEELVAELSACFVLAALALPDRMEELPNSASYLKHYLNLLSDDPRKLVKAAGLAQKASDFILNGGTVKSEKRRIRVRSDKANAKVRT